MKQKKKTKKRNKTNVRNKAWLITTLVIAALFALSLSLTVWSTVSDISPRQLVRDIFRLNQPAGYDGKNLLDASTVREFNGMYIYDAIELMPSTDYVLMPHAETLEAFGEGAMLILIFSNAIIADEDLESLDQIAFSGDEAAPDIEMLTLYLLPFKFAFSTAAYPYSYLTVVSGIDLSTEDAALKIKIERGLVPTVYTAFGVGTTELYVPPKPADPVDEDPEPTPLAVGDQITELYINNTAAGDAILRSLENIDEATCLLLSPSTSTSSGGKTIILADIEDVRILVAVWGDEGAQSFVLLWCSEAGADLSAVGLGVVTTAGWQQAANGDLAQSLGVTGYYVYANGNPQIEYAAWGDGDAELGRSNFDALFSSTPF